MKIIALLLLLLSFAIPQDIRPKLKKVSQNIYMVRGVDGLPSLENRGFMSNAFAVLTKEGWIIIDTLSTPELSREFLEELYKVKKAPVKYVIITHYHPDHYYGAKTFKDLGAKVIAHKRIKELYSSGELNVILEGTNKAFNGLYNSVVLVEPDMVVESKLRLKVGEEELEIIPMSPAHTDNDVVVYMPKGKVLFAGDLVYEKRIPFMGDRGASSKGWVEALKKMKEMEVKIILGGHNEPMSKDAIDFTLGYITYLRENIKRLKEEGKFIDDIKEALKDSPYKNYVMYDVFHNANIFKVDSELDAE